MKKSTRIIIISGISLIFMSGCLVYFLNNVNNKTSNNKFTQSQPKNKKRELLPEKTKEANNIEENNESETRNNLDESPVNPEVNNITKSEPEVLNGVKIGKRYKLNVATQAQQKWFWCAPTTVSMMLSARGKNISQSQLAGEMGTYEPFGTHNKDAVRILNRHMFGYDFPSGNQAGYRIETVRDKSPETLKKLKDRIIQNTKDGYPMYFTINPAKIYDRAKNSEHNVAGAGYISTPDDKDIAFIYFVDPYGKFHDETYGGLKIVTPEELLNAMVDPYVTEPNYAW